MEPKQARSELSMGMWTFAVAFGAMALLVGIIGLFTPTRGGGDGAGGGSSAAPKELSVELTEFAVTPASVDLEPGQKLVLTVTNKGIMGHDLKIGGTDGTALLDPGKSETVTVGPFDAATEAWCTVPGHKESGMVMKVNVGAAAAAPAAAGGAAAASGAKIDPKAEPAADFKPYDPTLAPAPGGTTHDVEMHAIEKEIEVAPGVTQMMWTFDGKVPGTILRGKVGDLFNVTLINDGKIEHSIDFHASKVAWNDEMRSIKPGERLTYQFKAGYAGAFMYHCGTAPALHHIGNGMYGAIIIDPPVLAPVVHEYVLVQSELYLGENGKEGDLSKMTAEAHDAVVFNGFWNQYKFKPIRIEPDERVRVWVIDDGPSENSAFHIVGTIFDTVFKEGSYLLTPDSRSGGSQVLDLQPAQGGFVEFTMAEAGLYPIVTHKFANVGKGALGLFQAGEVAAAGGGH